MEQRRLRLGDILDDYCPRERRVTNHAVVAIVEETVKQTRCTTCDAEHPYKGGQAPRRRKKEGTSALFKEVLAGKPDTDLAAGHDDAEAVVASDVPAGTAGGAAEVGDVRDNDGNEAVGNVGGVGGNAGNDDQGDADGNVMNQNDPPRASMSATLSRPVPPARREPAPAPEPAVHAARGPAGTDLESPPDAEPRLSDTEDGPVHRQLIRAQLPRIEGQKDERRPTDFTIRQSGGRGNNPGNQFRGGGGGSNRPRSGRGGFGGNGGSVGGNAGHGGNGHRPHGGRFARPGQGQGQGHGRGQGGGFRSAQQPRPGGGRKRSR
jgi:hypothetical protein